MEVIISVKKEGKYYVATDIVTNVADQGESAEIAVERLKKGLKEHYEILMQMASKDANNSLIDIEVDVVVPTSTVAS